MSNNFYKVYITLNKLLYNRGYFPSDNINLSEDTFLNIPRSELTIKTESRPDSKIQNGYIFVFFPDDEKIGVKTIRNYKIEMEEANVDRAIIVVKEGITPYARSNIQNEIKEPMIIEIFNESELLIDITEHSLVPKHELMTPSEKTEFLNRMKLKESQLPKLLSTDPVSRYYGFKRRDIVKITRPSETAGIYINYRVVVG